jgi:ABC-2 type transport system ATP-binding protein
MIDMTGLQGEQHKKIGALSKSYRQRVGLAQAMIHDPEVLILDEPTSGLDPNQLLEIRHLITEVGRTKTVMMSTHIMQEVEAICNRAVIIHKGRIIADDSTKNLQHMATSKEVISVEFDVAVPGDLLRAIPGVLEVNHNEFRISNVEYRMSNDGQPLSLIPNPESLIWHLVSAPGTDIRAAVFQFAVDHKYTVLSLHREEQKLEEVFQELTRG